MKCIVTGGSGFIGTHLVDELIRKNYEVLNIDIKPPILNAHIANWKERDILDSEALLEDFLPTFFTMQVGPTSSSMLFRVVEPGH